MVRLADVLNITLQLCPPSPTQHLNARDRCFVILDSVDLYSSFLELQNACVSNWSRKTGEIIGALCADVCATQ